MMDNELFELCREVYEKTGWERSGEAELNWWYKDKDTDLLVVNGNELQHVICPLYTSDYILTKLQSVHGDVSLGHWAGTPDKPKQNWHAIFIYEPQTAESLVESVESDTPLKAILKLTIALHKAGELK